MVFNMKFVRLASLLLSTIFIAAALSSCGDVAETSYTISVIVKNPKHDDQSGEKIENMDVVLATTNCSIKKSSGEQPTLLEAITTALDQESIKYTTDDASITSIKNNKEKTKTEKFKYTETDKNGVEEDKVLEKRFLYYWAYTVAHDGEEAVAPEGRPNEVTIQNGDHIVCYYTPSDPGVGGDIDDSGDDTEESNDDVVEE